MAHLLLLAAVYAVHASYECRAFGVFSWLGHPRWRWIVYVVPWGIAAVYLAAAVATAVEFEPTVAPTWEASLIEL